MSNQRWTESTSGFTSIDRDAGIIRGVKILGYESKNNRKYARKAVAEGAPLYEGAKVYLDHERDPKKSERRNRDRWGKLINVAVQEGGLFGDLQYLKSHAETETILESIEQFNDTGLSHDAGGVCATVKGETIVESITKVYSVDLVQNPATTANLFESEQPTVTKIKLLTALREHASLPTAARLLARITEMEDVYAPEMEMDSTAVEGSEVDPVAEVGAAFKAAIAAIVDSAMSTEEKMAKIEMLLNTKDELAEGQAKAKDAELSALQEQVNLLTAEKLKRDQELAVEQTRVACKELLESLKREPTDVRITALAACKEADRKGVAESWPEMVQRPASSPGKFQESLQPDADYKSATTKEEMKRRLGV